MPKTTVVFDIGQVLIAWDPRHLYRKIFDGDETHLEWFLSEVCHSSWNLEQDRGRSWNDAIAEATARHPRHAEAIRAYRERWHEMVPGAIEESVDLLHALAVRDVPLYAITNFAADTFAEVTQRFPFFALFRGIVVSGQDRLLKPDPRIYHLLAERYALDLADCLFIDDTHANVEGARAVGMQGHRFTSPEALKADLTARGLL
jgi:2-haloacid dehalogenase